MKGKPKPTNTPAATPDNTTPPAETPDAIARITPKPTRKVILAAMVHREYARRQELYESEHKRLKEEFDEILKMTAEAIMEHLRGLNELDIKNVDVDVWHIGLRIRLDVPKDIEARYQKYQSDYNSVHYAPDIKDVRRDVEAAARGNMLGSEAAQVERLLADKEILQGFDVALDAMFNRAANLLTAGGNP